MALLNIYRRKKARLKSERIRLSIIRAARASSLRGGRRGPMGSGGERVLPILQGYRERVLESDYRAGLNLPARWPVTRPDLKKRESKNMSTLEREKELLLERISDLGVSGGESYAYYLGGIDALNWVLSQEREGK